MGPVTKLRKVEEIIDVNVIEENVIEKYFDELSSFKGNQFFSSDFMPLFSVLIPQPNLKLLILLLSNNLSSIEFMELFILDSLM